MTQEGIKQNPGDLRLPAGWKEIKKKKVLIIRNNIGELINRSEFDEVVELKGTDSIEGQEETALDETTINGY